MEFKLYVPKKDKGFKPYCTLFCEHEGNNGRVIKLLQKLVDIGEIGHATYEDNKGKIITVMI